MAHGDITHIEIPVTDMAKAGAFYSGLFGWNVAEAPGFEGYPMWRAPNGLSGGALVVRADGFEQPRSYVEVDSIDEILAAVVGAGGAVLVPKAEIHADQLVGGHRRPGRQQHRPVRRNDGLSRRGSPVVIPARAAPPTRRRAPASAWP